jgi:hypothetical protein
MNTWKHRLLPAAFLFTAAATLGGMRSETPQSAVLNPNSGMKPDSTNARKAMRPNAKTTTSAGTTACANAVSHTAACGGTNNPDKHHGAILPRRWFTYRRAGSSRRFRRRRHHR